MHRPNLRNVIKWDYSILVSHTIDTIKTLYTRGLLLNRGSMVYTGAVVDVCEAYQQGIFNAHNELSILTLVITDKVKP